jgi:plastocyanin
MKLGGVVLAFLPLAAPVQAATVDAGIEDFVFDPAAITINQIDTVHEGVGTIVDDD